MADYVGQTYIEPFESKFINQFRNKLTNWRMLDIAVGAGRTTLHFASLIKSYVGIDYSSGMITECKKSLGDSLDDARNVDADPTEKLRTLSFRHGFVATGCVDHGEEAEECKI